MKSIPTLGPLSLTFVLSVLYSTAYAAGLARPPTIGISENFKKITSAPRSNPEGAQDSPIVVDESGRLVEVEEPILKPSVTIEPAPGTLAPEAKGRAPASVETNHVSAEQSLKWLTNGNTRFVKRNFRKDGRDASDRARTSAEAKPHALILGCSDPRVSPEIIFDQGLGEIATVRTTGEALDSSVLASLEAAVEKWSPRLLVVMGHTKCEAVDAALHADEGKSSGSEFMDKVIADIQPRLKAAAAEKAGRDLEIEATLNADGVARDLAKRSPLLKKRIESGELVVKSALYRLDSGKVTFY